MDSNDGIIFAYLLDGNGGGTALDWQGIRDWHPDTGPVWIHLDGQNERAIAWLNTQCDRLQTAREILTAPETRPRFVTGKNGIFLILRGINFNPNADPEDMVALRMKFEEHRIITMRKSKVMAATDMAETIEDGNGPKDVEELLTMMIYRIIVRIGEIITEIEDRIDDLEDAILTMEAAELNPKLASLRRESIRLRRYIAPQREVLARLYSEPINWRHEVTQPRLRELAERSTRFVEDLDAARERAIITQEELRNRTSEQMNRATHVLSIVAAIFLPLGLLTGLLGINVGGIPGAKTEWAFLSVSAILVVLAVGLVWWFKKIKWL